jgi:hypothetical protein
MSAESIFAPRVLNAAPDRPQGADQSARNTEREDEWAPLLPVPEDAPPPTLTLRGHTRARNVTYTGCEGPDAPVYVYRDSQGRLLGYVERIPRPGGAKEFRPHTFGELKDGRREWRARGPRAATTLWA